MQHNTYVTHDGQKRTKKGHKPFLISSFSYVDLFKGFLLSLPFFFAFYGKEYTTCYMAHISDVYLDYILPRHPTLQPTLQ